MRQGSQVCRSRRGHPILSHAIEDARIEITGAQAIQQHPDRHAPPRCRAQGGRKLRARRIVAEDIRAHGDRTLGALNRGQHLRIGLIAAFQDGELVAAGQGALADLLVHRRQQCDIGGRLGYCFAGGAGSGIIDPAQLQGAPGDTVNAEQKIEQRAEYRRQPHRADPPQRGAYIAFLQ